MQAPPKSRGPFAFRAFLHIAQRGLPFITVGAQTFGCHTSGGVRSIDPFASQNLPPSPQPKAEKGLTHAHEIHSTLGFCVTTPPASDAFLGSLKLPTSPPLPPRHHKIKTQISGPGTVTFDSPTHTMTHVLNPNTVPPTPAGQNQTFTVLATDAAGTPVPNAPVSLMVGGAHSLQLNGITGADGKVSFNYTGANPGTDTVQALGTVTGMFALSNQVTVTWGTPTPTPPSTPPPGLSLTVAGAKLLTLPDPAVYTAAATDPGLPAGGTIAISWIQLSGPATVTFATPQQAVTSVTFPVPGVYMLQATATDSLGAQATPVGPITVEPPDVRSLSAGWLNAIVTSPATGLIPIALNPGVTLTGGTLVYYPEQNFNGLTELDPAKMTVLNPNTTGSGTLATLDTTLLSNGPYYILLEATDSTGKTMGSGLEILVGGDYKPGRVTTTVTDLVVQLPAFPSRSSALTTV
jgi:hypothetical protein